MANQIETNLETGWHRDAWNLLIATRGGMNVFGREEAAFFRLVEQQRPDWITISECEEDYDGAGMLPYFRVTLTYIGQVAVRRYRRAQEMGRGRRDSLAARRLTGRR